MRVKITTTTNTIKIQDKTKNENLKPETRIPFIVWLIILDNEFEFQSRIANSAHYINQLIMKLQKHSFMEKKH